MSKLRKKNGETMVEALIACLIIALSITMLANVMTSASHVIQKARDEQKRETDVMNKFWSSSSQATPMPMNLSFGGIEIETELEKTDVVGQDNTTVSIYEFKTN